MDQFVTRDAGFTESQVPAKNLNHRQRWRHDIYEVEGRIRSLHKQALLNIMLQSYSEIGRFSQLDSSNHLPPGIENLPLHGFVQGSSAVLNSNSTHRPYISCLDFDSKGVYLASVSSSGCLGVHDYESLYCDAEGLNMGNVMPIVHISLHQKLEAIRWNPTHQDEVACVAAWGSKVYCYDISCVSYKPVEVLKVKSFLGGEQKFESTGLFDLAFCKLSAKRVLACGRDGNVHVWDRRISALSQSFLSGPQGGAYFNSLELTPDEQVIYAGSDVGQIHAWDLRGGRKSAAFLIPGEVYNPPFASWKVANLLEQIPSLRAQTEIETSGVQSISLNPCCDQQLAFHLNNGWSGVLDLSTHQVTHIHCPPPPWLEGISVCTSIRQRKPTWLSANSIYACGSPSSLKINLLDFKLGPGSLHHVEEYRNREHKSKVELSLSEPVVSCAAHPMNDHLVVGTENGSMLLIVHKRSSTDEDHGPS